jgi:hypothetical protein
MQCGIGQPPLGVARQGRGTSAQENARETLVARAHF